MPSALVAGKANTAVERQDTPKAVECLRALDPVSEPAPCGWGEPEHRSGAVPRIADEDPVTSGNFYAVAAAVPAIAGRAPAEVYLVFHCCAASKIRARLAARGSASA